MVTETCAGGRRLKNDDDKNQDDPDGTMVTLGLSRMRKPVKATE